MKMMKYVFIISGLFNQIGFNQSNHLIIYQSLFHFTSIFQFPCIVFLWLSPSELIAYTGSFKKSGTTIDIDRETSNISKLFVLLRASCKANCSACLYDYRDIRCHCVLYSRYDSALWWVQWWIHCIKSKVIWNRERMYIMLPHVKKSANKYKLKGTNVDL